MDCAGFGDGFLWQPYENSPCIEVYNEKDMWRCGNPCLDKELESFSRCLRVCELVGMGCKEKYFHHRVAMQFGMDQDIPGEVFLCKKDPWMIYNEPITILDLDLLIQLCSRQPNVTSRCYDRIKVEKSDGLTLPDFTSKLEKHQKEASDKEDHIVYELSSSDDEVVGNGKALCSSEFGDFTSSDVLDEDEINSLFCDGNGEKEESVGPSILDIAFDVENRIEKLEREVVKLKQARFGSKVEIVGAKAKP
ncbi:putative aminotransferase-like, plant mobile domain-containing protein [Medicago truncatula]|uniref:Putative aminotransferase-like, plant mobile domain-containing protein n=2 Tax=Medicago truncatula TaxID=3880 RepID=A0A396IRN0_MEDTR|nr:putative aminotransferase-like, plant mobile domain-containing protein [Medicago truncatula]